MRQLNTSTFWRTTAPLRAVRRLLGQLCYSRLGYPLVLAWHTLRTCSRVPLRDWRAERVIERSGLFDKDWYLTNNPDVVEWGINPVRHYVVFGAREGRDPSSLFSTRRYLSENGDVAGAGVNPLAHFVLYGAAEGRAGGADPLAHRQYPITTKPVNADERVDLLSALALIPEAVRFSGGARTLAATAWRVLRDEGLPGLAYRINFLNVRRLEARGAFDHIRLSQPRSSRTRQVRRHSATADIIVCVHNALDDVRSCLESVVACTTPPYRLIVVDDGSDELTSSFLREFMIGQPGLLLRHERALGYTRAANVGLKSSTAEFVVLLNSDTIVATPWLDRLIECAESDEQIGIVGPLSNTASWQSVPRISENGDWARNVLPDGLEVRDMASLVSDCSVRAFPRVGFLNGFCLLIRRALMDDIGYFDDDAFGGGYGEENDYCLRATEAGWKLAVAEDTYVYHAQSKSYSDERRVKLYAEADQALRLKHGSHIGPLLSITKDSIKLAACRARTSVARSRAEVRGELTKKYEGRRVLFLLPIKDAGGGANVVVTEARALMRAGVDAVVANLQMNKAAFEASYPILDLPRVYIENDLSDLTKMSSRFDAVVATAFNSVEWLKVLLSHDKSRALGYYVQDFEPYFFSKSDPRFAQALASYTLIPNLRLFTKSHWNAREVRRWIDVSPAVIGPSYDWDLFFPEEKRNRGPVSIAAMVRPSSPRRAPKLTAAVLERIAKTHTDRVALHIFGSSPEHPLLQNLKGLPCCVFHGKLSPERVCELFAATDIFADFSEYQAMGLTALEAMSCGATVVAPAQGGACEFIRDGETGLLIDTSDERACYRTLIKLVEDGALRRQLSLAALGDVVQYFPERPALAMMNALFDEQ
jgi:GT2 family glycosyltransferase